MAGSEEDVGGGSTMEGDTQGGDTTGFNADAGDTGDAGGGVGLGTSGMQTGSTSGDMSSDSSDSGVATDFPKAEALGAKETDDVGSKTDFLPPPTIAEFDDQQKGQES
jgi:hypothetical protein